MTTAQVLQAELDDLLQHYHVQGVGTGYIDLILPTERAVPFIAACSRLTIAIERVTWWCHCTPASRAEFGCPHRLGGPSNQFGIGWFSECVAYPDFCADGETHEDHYLVSSGTKDIPSMNAQVQTYLERELPREPWYHACLHPGLWLAVPDHWTRS